MAAILYRGEAYFIFRCLYQKLLSVFLPSSSGPSSVLLCPALCLNRLPSIDGITRAPLLSACPEFGLTNGTYRKLHWEEGPNIHYLCPSCLTAGLAMAQLSMAKRLVTSSITLTLQAAVTPFPPCVLSGSGVVTGFCCCSSPSTSTSLNGSLNPVSSLNSLCLNSF